MTKLMSDEELMKAIIDLSPYSTVPNEVECKDLFELFNTQKRLYAESVIGKDERPASEGSLLMKQLSPNTNRIDWRNELRAEQRARMI